jgi:hypothetical protein
MFELLVGIAFCSVSIFPLSQWRFESYYLYSFPCATERVTTASRTFLILSMLLTPDRSRTQALSYQTPSSLMIPLRLMEIYLN